MSLALALHQQGHTVEALTQLQKSLVIATPEGWVRPFVEIGAPMAALLERLPAESTDNAVVRKIMAAIAEGPAHFRSLQTPRHGEDLTNRERDVLELLGERLRDKEIAERLFISPQTVKTHLRSLYQKLECGNRRRAVARARELGLLP